MSASTSPTRAEKRRWRRRLYRARHTKHEWRAVTSAMNGREIIAIGLRLGYRYVIAPWRRVTP